MSTERTRDVAWTLDDLRCALDRALTGADIGLAANGVETPDGAVDRAIAAAIRELLQGVNLPANISHHVDLPEGG